ncbi:hypothetical protein ACTL6P_14595 [Endozoicomonas acroporae]|uniref:hypothetical protein n=1 Tax=Endozoicomonas acroporae TaxID=1701104 RepID=UPI0015E0DAAF|nr:hypothetical protein [Endozoicomonas acroporae]
MQAVSSKGVLPISLHTNLAGRLRNTNLPKSHGLLPVFEAVVNSIQSLEEANR